MFDFQQKRRLRTILESRVTWALLLVLIAFMLVSAYERYTIAREMSERRATAEAEIEQLRLREMEITNRVDYLSTERGQEAEMRRQFDVGLPGEQVVIILDENDSAPTVETPPATTTVESRPWYRFW